MEAVWKIEVVDFPAFIVVDDKGNDFFAGIMGDGGWGREAAPARHHLIDRCPTSATHEDDDMATHVWQYPKCSTCRKALKWMNERGVRFDAQDIVAAPPPQAKLRDLWQRSGLPIARFFNTSGESYRAGGFKERLRTMTDIQALAALAADGKLIKRPLVDTGTDVLVGFDEDRLRRRVPGHAPPLVEAERRLPGSAAPPADPSSQPPAPLRSASRRPRWRPGSP